MCNRCFNPHHGYWTQKWLQIPYSCINCSIDEVCLNCPQTEANNKIANTPEAYEENAPNYFKNDPRDHYWTGRCKTDRGFINPFTEHFRRPHPCRHRGDMGSMTHRTICTPGFLKYFLFSPVYSTKKCYDRPTMDPFEKARLTDANDREKRIPFVCQDLDRRVGHWFEQPFDEFGNPIQDEIAKSIQSMLLKGTQVDRCLPYENLDNAWLNQFCEFYKEVAATDETAQMDEMLPPLGEICNGRDNSK